MSTPDPCATTPIVAAHSVGVRDHVDATHKRLPASGVASVVRILTAVDLPAPLGPSSANTLPRATLNESPSSAVTPFG